MQKLRDNDQLKLFNLPEVDGSTVIHNFKSLENRIWTKNKANLIQRYLRLFVFITKHGMYIDGFSGPQYSNQENSWSAKLVIEFEPKRLTHFFLCETNPSKYEALKKLKADNTDRVILLYDKDFNISVKDILNTGLITEKKATFCLLDQHSTECHWKTVQTLAHHKSSNKIELFYFFATGWLDRVFAAQKDERVLEDWWGNTSWKMLVGLNNQVKSNILCDRFKNELNYKYAYAWPIFEKEHGGGNIMYFMIHASDHFEAPNLMARAYRTAVSSMEPPCQIKMELDEWMSRHTD